MLVLLLVWAWAIETLILGEGNDVLRMESSNLAIFMWNDREEYMWMNRRTDYSFRTDFLLNALAIAYSFLSNL